MTYISLPLSTTKQTGREILQRENREYNKEQHEYLMAA